jgi:hypothetical protein
MESARTYSPPATQLLLKKKNKTTQRRKSNRQMEVTNLPTLDYLILVIKRITSSHYLTLRFAPKPR